MKNKKIIFITGPTAVGKSAVAVNLAKKINAEIISCDSMQVYKGMDILTSKPTGALKRGVRHHLISIVSPEEKYSVFRYYREAICKIKEVINRGKIPLFVGGSGLYMSALIDGIFKAKAQDERIRNRLYQEFKTLGSVYLYEKLKKVDPEAAKKIHPHDIRRVVRALEVFEITGKPISMWQKQRKGLSSDYEIKIFCLNMPRQSLYKRIDKRVDKMFTRGILNEVKKLLRLNLSKTAFYAIGIRELKGYLEGLYNLDEAKRLIKRNSRAYARRQLTWFRKDKRIEWIDIGETEGPKKIAEKIWKRLC